YDGVSVAKPTIATNAKNQANTVNYSNTPDGGFSQWIINQSDANGNKTAYTYDYLGRTTSVAEPGETSGLHTQDMVYANWCSTTSASTPCVEEDSTQRLDSS